VITQANGIEEEDRTWAVGTVNRELAFLMPHGCFSLREGRGTVRKGNPFQDPDKHIANQTLFLSHYLK
jgi:hypothetical protein